MHNHNKFDRVFVALSPAIFMITLCVSLLAAYRRVAELYSDSATAIVCLQLYLN